MLIYIRGSKLKSNFVIDLKLFYEFKPKTEFKSIFITGLVNTIFDYKYISNGCFYTYDDNWINL